MKFKPMSFFIGIDQTGAINSHGKPKKLSAAIIICEGKNQRFYANQRLTSLSQEDIEALILQLGYTLKLSNTYICVDAALGLAKVYKTSIRAMIKKTRNFSYLNKSYGSITAYHFFKKLRMNKPIIFRKVEIKVEANSVFFLKPFQRNIGCGTYRILKDLSANTKWYTIWPFEKKSIGKALICEGYPSYSWKYHFGIKNRNLVNLNKLWPNISFQDQNYADSFILAWACMQQLKNFKTTLDSKEGWILGVPFKSEE